MLTNRPLLSLVLGGLGVSLLSLVIWIAVNDGDNRMAFGRIIEITETTVTVEDRQERQRTVTVVTETNILQRGEQIGFSELEVGQFVHINGKLQENQEVTATTIRLLRPPRED